MTLPEISIAKYRRVDRPPVMAVARVRLGDFLSLSVRLLAEEGAKGPTFDVGGNFNRNLGVRLAPELAETILDALVLEYPFHKAPDGRVSACRHCEGPVRFERGKPVDPATMEAHRCR